MAEYEDFEGTGVPSRNRPIRTIEKNQPNGVAGLDGSGQLDPSVFPAGVDENFANTDLLVLENRTHSLGDSTLAFDLSDAPNTAEHSMNVLSGFYWRKNSVEILFFGLGSQAAQFGGRIDYLGDYSSGFNNRSLVDKEYVDSQVKNNGAYYVSTPAATIITTANTPVKALGTTTAMGTATNITVGTNRLTIDAGQAAGEYIAEASLTAWGEEARLYTFYFAKNGVVLTSTAIQRELQNNATKAGALALQWKGSLTASDYLEVWVENNENTRNATIEKMQVTLQKL